MIAETLEGYTGSDIKEVCREAVVRYLYVHISLYLVLHMIIYIARLGGQIRTTIYFLQYTIIKWLGYHIRELMP
jgi:hypothetical protein